MSDERTKKYFPPIVNQIGESCAAYSTTYYTMTYMNAMANDYDVKTDPSKILSPRFTYNLGNEGTDGRINRTTAFQIALKHGCPSIVDFPVSGANQHSAWPTEARVWRNALNHKVKETGYGYIGSSDMKTPVQNNQDENLKTVKTYLANGYVLNMCTWIGSWKLGYRYGTSEKVCVAVDGDAVLHEMTVVGYDDTIWVDINGNGRKDTGESGAFKIVNSHGSNWEGRGWMWFAYDALNEVSSVSGAPIYGNRINGWEWNIFYWATAYKAYEPILICQFTVHTNKRNQISMKLGQSGQSDMAPLSIWEPYVLNHNGGALSIHGTTAAASATIVLDYTDIIKKTDLSKAKTTKWYVQYKGQDAIFSDMYIKDETKNVFYALNGMYTDGDYSCKQKELFLPCIIDIGKQWNLKFNWPLNASTVTKQNIFVRDTKGNEAKVAVKLNSDKKTVRVTAPQEGYAPGRRYILNVTKGVKTQGGNCLTNEAGFEFIVK